MAAAQFLQFLDFSFNTETGELSSPRDTVRLQPQPALALRMLLENAGTLVTRDALKRAIWPDTVVESDQGLNFCVRQIRLALGEDADGGGIIETLPRRGYRFVPSVRVLGAPSENLVEARRPARWPIAAGCVAVLTVVALVIYGNGARSQSTAPVGIAILPLTTAGSDAWSAEKDRSITEALVTSLTNFSAPRLAVVGPSTTAVYASAAQPHTSIGSQLGVQFVVSGGVRLVDSTLFVQAIRVRDGVHVFAWRQPLQGRDADNLASIISTELAKKLR